MKVALTLHDECARAVLHQIARRYAVLCIYSRMPSDIVNAPWSGRWERAGRKKSWQAVYREWMAEVDRERASYRKTLLSFVDELPDVPGIEMKPYTPPRSKETYSGVYSVSKAGKIADEYAIEILEMVSPKPKSPAP